MKKIKWLFCFAVTVVMLAGCGNTTKIEKSESSQESVTEVSSEESVSEEVSEQESVSQEVEKVLERRRMSDDTESPYADFQAVLRFTVGSDLQYGESTGKTGLTKEDYAQRFADFCDLSYDAVAADASYEGCDLIAMVGDMTASGATYQYDDCVAVTDKHIEEDTIFQVVMGNHEYYYNSGNAVEVFNSYYGEENTVYVLEGYYFIGISCTKEVFSEETLKWLDEQLSIAAAADPTGLKPIFVFCHQNPSDTVLGSQSDNWGWDDENIGKVLVKYPQVINFTGHSHFAIEDPASFWQGEYSVFNTGTLAHLCKFNSRGVQITVTDNDNKFDDNGKYYYAAAYVVEVDAAGNTVVRAFDVLTGKYIGETYYLEAGKKDYHYSTRFADAVIYFEEDAAVTIDELTEKKVFFTFDVCSTEGLLANNYMIELVESSGDIKRTEYISYEYFIRNPNQKISWETRVSSLEPETEYTIRVYGINPLYKSTVVDEGRKTSEPISATFTTLPAAAEE